MFSIHISTFFIVFLFPFSFLSWNLIHLNNSLCHHFFFFKFYLISSYSCYPQVLLYVPTHMLLNFSCTNHKSLFTLQSEQHTFIMQSLLKEKIIWVTSSNNWETPNPLLLYLLQKSFLYHIFLRLQATQLAKYHIQSVCL